MDERGEMREERGERTQPAAPPLGASASALASASAVIQVMIVRQATVVSQSIRIRQAV